MTALCTMPHHGIICPIFVGNKVTAEQYVKFLENALIPINQCDPNFDKMWFMQTEHESIGPKKCLISWKSTLETAFWLLGTQRPLERKSLGHHILQVRARVTHFCEATIKKMCAEITLNLR